MIIVNLEKRSYHVELSHLKQLQRKDLGLKRKTKEGKKYERLDFAKNCIYFK